MHVGLIPLNREKRVTSLQEQQCQLAGQGPIGELGRRDSLGARPEAPVRWAPLCMLPWGLLTATFWGDRSSAPAAVSSTLAPQLRLALCCGHRGPGRRAHLCHRCEERSE